jgi:hypothetical protein
VVSVGGNLLDPFYPHHRHCTSDDKNRDGEAQLLHYDKRAVLHVENRLGSEAPLSNLTHSCEDKPHQVLGGAKKHHIVPGSPLSLILKNAQKYESREVYTLFSGTASGYPSM